MSTQPLNNSQRDATGRRNGTNPSHCNRNGTGRAPIRGRPCPVADCHENSKRKKPQRDLSGCKPQSTYQRLLDRTDEYLARLQAEPFYSEPTWWEDDAGGPMVQGELFPTEETG